MNIKHTFITFHFLLFFSFSCNQGAGVDEKKEGLVKIIQEKEAAIRRKINDQAQPEIKLALEAIEAYRNFIFHYSEDSMAPYYHFRMARLFDGVINDKPQAILEYDRIYNNYQKFPERPLLLFFEGSAFQDMGDTTNAIQTLNMFLAKYPKHEFSDDAQGLIEIMRMSPEEFQKKYLSSQDSTA